MPPTVYNYTISTAFPNQKVYIPSLESQIRAALPAPAPQLDPSAGGIGANVTALDNCDIWFDAALDVAQEASLDAVVAAHTGIGVVATMFGTTEIANLPHAITEVGPVDWEAIGGVVTTPSFFNPDMSQLMGRVLGKIRTDGPGAKIKICETTDLGVKNDISPVLDLPDTGGTWQTFRLDTNQPPADSTWNEYKLVGQTGGVVTVEFQFTTFSMLQVLIV